LLLEIMVLVVFCGLAKKHGIVILELRAEDGFTCSSETAICMKKCAGIYSWEEL